MLSRKVYSGIFYNSGIFIFVGAISFYFYSIIFHSDENINANLAFILCLILGLALIFIGAYIKSFGNHNKANNALYLVVSMSYIFLIVALELDCNINIYAMVVGLFATACALVVEFKKRRHHEHENVS